MSSKDGGVQANSNKKSFQENSLGMIVICGVHNAGVIKNVNATTSTGIIKSMD